MANLTEDDLNELCRAVEEYQLALSRAEEEIVSLKNKLEEGKQQDKYQELEETILQLDSDLSSAKSKLKEKSSECEQLKREKHELESLVKSTVECLEELNREKSQSLSPSQKEFDNLRKQLETSETIRLQQETNFKKYEEKSKTIQESLQQEIDLLKSKSEENMRRNGLRDRDRDRDPDTQNGFQKRTPPTSARRIKQSSSSPSQYEESVPDLSPRQSMQTPPRLNHTRLLSAKDSRRHSSYTTGDYAVTYCMKQGDPNLNKKINPELETIITPRETKDMASSFIADLSPQQQPTLHPYYPHSAVVSTLWQETVAQQNPLEITLENLKTRESGSFARQPNVRKHRQSSENLLNNSRNLENNTLSSERTQNHLYSPLEYSPSRPVSSHQTTPQFTQPKILPPPSTATPTGSNSPTADRKKFTVKRIQSEEDEGRAILGTRFRNRKVMNPSKIVPIKLPASPTITRHNSLRSESEILSTQSSTVSRDVENTHGTNPKFYQYHGNSPLQFQQSSLDSSTLTATASGKWQQAKVRTPQDSSYSLKHLSSNIAIRDESLHPFSPKPTRLSTGCSDSSEEYVNNKFKSTGPNNINSTSDESDRDRDFEIECDEEDGEVGGDGDDSSVKVELGGYKGRSRRKTRRSHPSHSQSHSLTHRYLDLGNITVDCE